MSEEQEPTVADLVGGVDAFIALVDDFFERVETDPLLRPVYPDELEPGKTHFAQFLAQYFGAGPVYSSHRGHPRLRMRHGPFTVTRQGAEHWAAHMSDAIRAQGFPAEAERAMLDYVAWATPQMVNTEDHAGGLPLH